ncbi:fumarylacetoacetate hydrolase family protein [Zhihengliuella salsuginis]|uniref:2-hydroxyhepta-2,4-diene-1,7-dioate isomerase n=1 Tax=Zhihengliuella salsuginis TaxID=578222 RepID=A0ABQ3GI09_9MICC|nr:fumarylacetoacetate hydrolase family protein [Zhihengliuella salsuginis]GHD07956.1 2-hydroxyhepta-2,4-diene-1,7-dioate isomerase [Zhihengliuella salsuginis]
MKLTTLSIAGTTTAAVGVGHGAFVPLDAPDLGALLAGSDWRQRVDVARASGAAPVRLDEDGVRIGPLVPRAGKVICCGLNYADHITEMGRDLPEYPTLFAKFADTLTGPADDIAVSASAQVDWEAELGVVVGRTLTDADETEAEAAIAGYTVANDISMRDWQRRTLQWFQGKAFDATTPVGPVMVTPEEVESTRFAGDGFTVRGYVNGDLVQEGRTRTLVFGPARLLSYISRFTTLRPGDLVLTGTPGGVGMGMEPPRFLRDGDVVATEIDGIGRLENRVRLT